jgi:hypothetical protein
MSEIAMFRRLWWSGTKAERMICTTYADQYVQQLHRRPRFESKEPRTFHHQHQPKRGPSLGSLRGWCLVSTLSFRAYGPAKPHENHSGKIVTARRGEVEPTVEKLKL